jgi:hypothetical protein
MPVAQSFSETHTKRQTQRGWWWEPTFTLVSFTLFVLWSMWEVLFHQIGTYGNYVSPYFSPGVASWFHIRVVPALWGAWVPLFFRATCYYYRREYYRAFFRHPVACAIREPSHRTYVGEIRAPFAWNYLHRFFLYLSIIVVIFLWIDAVEAFDFGGHFGIGLGSIILLIDAVLLSLYTFSCHAYRHWIGGGLDCFSCENRPRRRYVLWRWVSQLNLRHGLYAWVSMFWVWGTAVYVRLLIMGVIHDPRWF